MVNGLDRLERLFSYKRKSSREPLVKGRIGSTVQPLDQQFPPPSFIRPKTSRMTARQEVRPRPTTERSPSIPDIRSARAVHGHNLGSASADSHYQSKHKPARSPSFSHPQTEDLVSVLRDFQFPKPPSRNGDKSSLLRPFNVKTLAETPRLPSPPCRSPLEISIPLPYRLDTPPSSDPEDNLLDSPFPSGKEAQFSFSTRLPTPDQTPEIRSAHDSQLKSVKSADCLDNAFQTIEDQLGELFDQCSFDRTYSQSSVTHSTRSFCGSILREPDFSEFLNLSDDDIAESPPDSPVLVPLEETKPINVTSDLWISSSEPLTSRLLTLTPPRASRPAAAAAFEAARIARRYDFDLVYVVNLWPDRSNRTMPGRKPMIGRLLAAHGLHHVPSPLEISTEVHTTILRSDGWIEYRNQEALPHDLARGYACAFYTGQYARSSSSRCASPVSGVRLSEKIDRGIVFAAYRKPRNACDKLGRTLNDAELGELHRNAEVLVEMVIDIQVASRSRQPSSPNALMDDIGPIPTQQDKVSLSARRT